MDVAMRFKGGYFIDAKVGGRLLADCGLVRGTVEVFFIPVEPLRHAIRVFEEVHFTAWHENIWMICQCFEEPRRPALLCSDDDEVR